MAEKKPLGIEPTAGTMPRANILLVDDKPANLLALRAILDDLGQNLIQANSGEQALRQLQSEEFAVVLLDVLMPGLDGFETAKLIRGQNPSRHTPIIFLTAENFELLSQMEKGYSLGAVDFLVKPLVPMILKAKVSGFVEMFQEQQRTKREAHQLRLLIDGTSEYAIFMLDPEGNIVTWNPGAERIKQYRADEIIGQHFSRFYPQEAIDRGWPTHELNIAKTKGRFEDEGWRVRKDGTQFWANVVITAIRDEAGNLQGFSKLTRDVTAKKKAEENAQRLLQETAARQAAEEYAQTIERQKEQLRVTLKSIGDAVITTDAEGRVTLLNAVAEALTGWTTMNATGQPLQTVFHIINEMTRETVADPVAKVFATGCIVGLANHTILIARDGTERPIDDSAAPIKDQDGQIAGVVLVFRDITERRKDEEERKRHEQELKQADRRKDEFLATLAHELRNPLAPITNALELIKGARGNDVVIEEARSLLERQVRHMVRLIDDLLELGRISTGKLELRKERVELAAVVQSVLEASRPFIEAHSHELTVSLPQEPIHLYADPIRLSQVLWNLLNNAGKYTEKGGHIWLTVERQGGEVVMSVRDTGIGIATEHLPRIFDMFSQVAPALERSQGGLGVGLALVRGLVELHGGTVEARSGGIGMGSEFIVQLPIVDVPEAKETQEPTESGKVPSGAKRRILVVDDNRDSADSLATMLQMMGHETRTAYNGLDALKAAEAFLPDVALLDLGLPKMNGYEIARRIREQPWGNTMVLIALTGWGQEEDRQRSKKAGFDHHLVKPIKVAKLNDLWAGLKPPQ